MCGIGGVRRFGDTPITLPQIAGLMVALENRGTDAAGIAVQGPEGQVDVLKSQGVAWRMLHDKGNQEWLEARLPQARIVMVHTRAASVGKGPPQDNQNNHPVFDPEGDVFVIHNGRIQNDYALFNKENLQRKAEVDTDVIRALLDRSGIDRGAVEALRKLEGNAAIAVLSRSKPGELLLGRSGPPLCYALGQDQFVWASTREALYRALKRWVYRWGVGAQVAGTGAAFGAMPDDTIWKFGPYGKVWHEQWRVCQRYTPSGYEDQRRGKRESSALPVIGTKPVPTPLKPPIRVTPLALPGAKRILKPGETLTSVCLKCSRPFQIGHKDLGLTLVCPNETCRRVVWDGEALC